MVFLDEVTNASSEIANSSGSSAGGESTADFFTRMWETIKGFFTPENIADVAFKVVIAIVLVVLCHYLVKLINLLVFKGLSRSKEVSEKNKAKGKKPRSAINYSVIYFIQALVRVILYLIVFVIILAMFGADFTGLGTILAGAVAGISLSLQDVISSFAYGVVILTTKEFKIGDYVMITSGPEGTVMRINLLTTMLITPSKEEVFIPNNVIGKASVVNVSAQETMVVRINFKVPTSSDIGEVRKIVIQAALDNPKTLKEPEPYLIVNGLEDRAMLLQLRAYVPSDHYWDLGWDLNEAIVTGLQKANIPVGRGEYTIRVADPEELKADLEKLTEGGK